MSVTSSTIVRDTDVHEAFETLKRTATTMRDIEAWFASRPMVLGAPTQLPEVFTVFVQISYYPNRFVKSVIDNNRLDIIVTCRITGTAEPDAAILVVAPTIPDNEAQYFSHSYNFELDLLQWPVATALVAAECTNVTRDMAEQADIASFERRVNHALDLHFGSTTLESLARLVEADLVAMNGDDDVDIQAFMSMLFMSSQTHTTPSIPTDLAP